MFKETKEGREKDKNRRERRGAIEETGEGSGIDIKGGVREASIACSSASISDSKNERNYILHAGVEG